MQTSACVAFALVHLICASPVLGDSTQHCKEAVCMNRPASSEKAHSLFQSGRSVMPNVVLPLHDDDDEDFPSTSIASKSQDDPAYYFAVCLDILIVAIVANGVQRYRNGDHLKVRESRQSGSSGFRVAKKKEQFDVGSVSLLHAAVREGDLAECEALLGKCSGTSLKRLLAGQDFWGCTALHLACDGGKAALVALLLDRGADAGKVDTWDQTPLHFAARSNSADVCKLLIGRGAAIDAVDSDERTPLHIAALAGHQAACEELLDHGATLQSVDDTDVPPVLSALLVQRMFQQLPSVK